MHRLDVRATATPHHLHIPRDMFLNLLSFHQNKCTSMAPHINHHEEKIIEQCQVAPPQGSLPSTIILPLTFFDIGWFLCPPVKRIFFYDFPYSTKHFLESALPTLKHSLSLTLQHFFPFVSNLVVPLHPNVPFIRYQQGSDSLFFTVAESKADFTLVVSDSPQDIRDWHPFVPSLPPKVTLEDGTRVIPLMAIQVTILPNAGFAICLTFNHIAADGKSLHHFMKFWANLCKQIIRGRSDDLGSLIEGSNLSLPFHGRDIVKDTKGLKHVYLEEIRGLTSDIIEFQGLVQHVPTNMVRATLMLSRGQVEKLKKWVCLKYCDTYGSGTLLHMSTFVVTCSLIWVCMIESEERSERNSNGVTKDSDELCYLIFLADCRGRLEFSIPSTYFGNCLVTGIVALKRGELVGENGIVEVASAIERDVRDLRSDALKRAENMMSNSRELRKPCKLVVAGSPKLAVYETDFGWGKPKKSGAVHVESPEAFSLSDSRGNEGAIEVGFALERIRMNAFINIFEEHLDNIDHSLSMKHFN